MLRILLLVIYVSYREIELVDAADKLEFWSRNPEYEARRAIKTSKYDAEVQKLYSKYKTTKVNHHKENSRNVTVHSKKEQMEPIFHAQSRTDGDASKWPKVQPHRYKKKTRKEAIRSTRMTPVYLMQKSDSHEKANPGHDAAHMDTIRENLSPYGIKHQLVELSSKFPEANISVEVIGRTIEYNDIAMLKVTERKSEISKYFRADDTKYVDEVPEKKIIFIVHALSVMGVREVPCLHYTPDFIKLLSYYFAHLDKFDIFLIPLANPDGFANWEMIWNKNMSPQNACPGVALDRNFDVGWNTSTAVSSCSQHFPGLTPFSEPETKAVRNVLHHFSHKIHAYFHVHAGTYKSDIFKGDAVLYPKGYSDVQSDDDKYIDMHGEIEEAMKNASFQVISVTVDTLHNWYGKISGSSVDYASTVYGIPYALELVMQPYADVMHYKYTDYALEEIWKRVIDVIFNNIWRSTKTNEI